MNTKSRIKSVLNAQELSESITGIPSFSLAKLELNNSLDFSIPTNLRLGHLVERIVSELIKNSLTFSLVNENIQLMEEKTTIGELDFIVKENSTNRVKHIELAYKFYLFDPSISKNPIYNWIGPNRNDSLINKLEKLKHKQFPLLFHPNTRLQLKNIPLENVSQELCLIAALFIPYQYQGIIDPDLKESVKGYYLNINQFRNLNNSKKTFYIPPKKEWGMDPNTNDSWSEYLIVEKHLQNHLTEKQSPIVWSKEGSKYEVFFVVWW